MSAATRARILEAADQVIRERGAGGMSIAEVARRAGVLKGNVAYYFRTKDALLETVARTRRERLFGTMASSGCTNTAREEIESFLDMVQGQAEDLSRCGCPVGSLCTELGKGEQGALPAAATSLREIQIWLHERLARQLPAREAGQLAERLLSQLQGAAVLAQAYRDPDVVRRQVRQCKDELRGLLSG
ncbi:helix-turn-helix domain-containing protein [Niveibacterium sp. SC-1]|uniref:TetR/AcrR family transcriptional regulator n=1 Tax=Niveibacterium sp. SC-1 TaxID=3135646 RepID=UPI00311F7DB8